MYLWARSNWWKKIKNKTTKVKKLSWLALKLTFHCCQNYVFCLNFSLVKSENNCIWHWTSGSPNFQFTLVNDYNVLSWVNIYEIYNLWKKLEWKVKMVENYLSCRNNGRWVALIVVLIIAWSSFISIPLQS